MSKDKTSHEELKEILEQSSIGTPVKGEIANLKSPEERQADKEILAWKGEKHKTLNVKEFRVPKQLIKVIMTTHEYHGLIFYGEGGIGKTVMTLSEIKNSTPSPNWEYSNGYTTPLALYEYLYKNRNKKVIVLDDVEGIFNNALSMSILKGALWDSDGKRIVQYQSKSSRFHIPYAFVMQSKIIILCNKIPRENDANTKAMMSRTISYDVQFSYKQKLEICEKFIKGRKDLNEGEQQTAIQLLKNNTSEATENFNFRTVKKAIAFVKSKSNLAEATVLFQATTKVDWITQAFLEATNKAKVITQQIDLFMGWTGKSRRTFFRIKTRLSAKVPQFEDMTLDTSEGEE